jgi:hypothetical protein
MNPEYEAINRFHDKRRRLEYARIKKNLNLPFEDEYTNHVYLFILLYKLRINRKKIVINQKRKICQSDK